jgi:hypothetical protein
MDIPKIHPLSWGDRFKVKVGVNVLYVNWAYEIVGIGTKRINGEKVTCWNVRSVDQDLLIPKDTITKLYEKKYIVQI